MSAGSGLTHSEYNYSDKEIVNLLQIWILPKEKNITPRYDQKIFDAAERKDKWQKLVSPQKNNGTLWINQNAYFSRANTSKDSKVSYKLNDENNGFYVFLIDGEITIDSSILKSRDAIGIYETEQIIIESKTKSDVLVIEVPMK
jgi:redox-sensitive bicupin YhaK (pirin superfamily)